MFRYYSALIPLLSALFLYLNLSTLYSESPSFVRQEVDDGPDDMLNISNKVMTNEELSRCRDRGPSVDINGISYVSDNKFLNVTVWLNDAFQSYLEPGIKSSVSEERPSIIYRIGSINSALNVSEYVKKVTNELLNSEQIDSVELIPMKVKERNNYEIIFSKNSSDTKFIWLFTTYNNKMYFHSFEIPNDENVYKKYLPTINQIINSTEFIEYSNTTLANYVNPYFGVKLQYPIELFKNFKYHSSEDRIRQQLYDKWKPIFLISNEAQTTNFEILTKDKTEDFDFEDFKREMTELYVGDKNFINYTSDFEIEELLNVEKNYTFFNIEREEGISKYILALVTKDNKMYAFTYRSDNDDDFLKYLPLYNQIINSTEFIEYSNTTLANYVNPYFGVKLQYPPNWKLDRSSFTPNVTSNIFGIAEMKSQEFFEANPIATFESDEKSKIVKRVYTDDRPNPHAVDYYMLIDITSVYDKGTDYAILISWNETSSNWDRLFTEYSATSASRRIDIENNISDFYERSKVKGFDESKFITFTLDLRKVNSPDKYKILIGTQASYSALQNHCFMADVSQLLPIPPPNYSIKPILNNPLILYPNDEKTFDLEIDSDSPTSSTVLLKPGSTEGGRINLTFAPDTVSLNPNEKGFSKVKITTDNATVESHNVPISANFTFPPELQYSILGINYSYTNPVMTNIPLNSNLTMTVEPVPPFYTPAVDFIKNSIEPSAGFITATVIPIATAILGLKVYFNRKRSSSRKKNKGNNIKNTSKDQS